MAEEVRFVDTTLRDGVQSLWASRLRTGEALPALGDIDAVGYEGVELLAPASSFSRGVKVLKEDPWELPRAVGSRDRHSDFRLHGTMKPVFGRLPRTVRELALERLAGCGLRTTRAASSWNDPAALARDKELLDRFGIRFVADLVFSVSPRHTDEYYVDRTRRIAAFKPWRVCFKDVGGLLDPARARRLLPKVLANLGGIELEFHAHSTIGLAPLTVLAAVECGVRVVHVATPPVANGYSQPSVFNVAANLRDKGFEPAVDLRPAEAVSAHLGQVARVEGLPTGFPLEYEERLYRHQIPGGMMTNLQYQLRQLGAEDRLEATLNEVEQVRSELGYPIMITPLSQFVATQAALNVIGGERYALVSDEVIQYSLGRWGEEALQVMDTGVRARILDRPRAEELSTQEEWDPSLRDLRSLYGNDISDEELILRVYVGDEAREVLRRARRPPATYDEYQAAHRSLPEVVEEIAAGVTTGAVRVDWRTPEREISIVRDPGSVRDGAGP